MRRTVLLGTLAAAVVAVLVVTGLWVGLGPDDGGSDGAETAGSGAAGAGTSGTAAEPVLLGDQRYLSPCRVLPLDDAVRLFGPLERNGYVRQEYHESSMPMEAFRKETHGKLGYIESICEYDKGDAQLNGLTVSVDQFRDPERAEGAFTQIAYLGTGKDSEKLAQEEFAEGFEWVAELARENERNAGGHPVAGARRTLLYVPGHQDFVTFAGDALVRLRYAPASFADRPLSPREYARQVPLMRKAASIVRRNVTDEDLPQGPAPTTVSGEESVGDATYLEPCDVLTAEVFEDATGHAPGPEVSTTSLRADPAELRARNDDVLSRSVDNTCERRWGRGLEKPGWDAELRLRYAPDAEHGQELLDRMVGFEYSPTDDRDKISKDQLVAAGYLQTVVDTDADTLYYFDSSRQTGEDTKFTTAFFQVGPYAGKISIDGSDTLGQEMFAGKDLDLQQYADVVDALVANIEQAAGA